MTKTEVGERVKRIRESKGMGLTEFAIFCGVSQGQMCNYEHGLHYPALPVLERICTAGGLRMSDFWREEDTDSKIVPTIEEIGMNVWKLRTLKGLTLMDLSDKSGVSPAAICDIEHGTRRGMITTFLYLAAALEVPLTALIYGED